MNLNIDINLVSVLLPLGVLLVAFYHILKQLWHSRTKHKRIMSKQMKKAPSVGLTNRQFNVHYISDTSIAYSPLPLTTMSFEKITSGAALFHSKSSRLLSIQSINDLCNATSESNTVQGRPEEEDNQLDLDREGKEINEMVLRCRGAHKSDLLRFLVARRGDVEAAVHVGFSVYLCLFCLFSSLSESLSLSLLFSFSSLSLAFEFR